MFTIQQAVCMFYLKPTKDPLQLISKLDALTLISRTQVKNPEFIEETIDKEEYEDLEDD